MTAVQNTRILLVSHKGFLLVNLVDGRQGGLNKAQILEYCKQLPVQ